MANKKLPDLDRLSDEEVLACLEGCVQLSFNEGQRAQKRVDRMARHVYDQAAQLLLRLQRTSDDHSTGRIF
ncbi:MAG TPA: hypothetical protein DEB30_03790 [Candidatus Peribacter riflensis]|nr:MAG: hypothetical protein A2398_00705 [Candidatus Peribacteria bacterium RIFOXYB1_FULL_57_12]HBH19901.1 hypothetical protein [Candidatus Peribacter riflensis]HBU09890.1 hypothetical protein [Candidatus Peribacter riflensis]